MRDWVLAAEAEECRLLAVEFGNRPESAVLLQVASAFEGLHAQKVKLGQQSVRISLSEFVARENIRRFTAQLLEAEGGITRNATIQRLLNKEKDHLRDLLTGRE